MWLLPVRITASTRSDFPGWVACEFTDAHGRTHCFEEKAPVVAGASFDPNGLYPQTGVIACTVEALRRDDSARLLAWVNTENPWGIQSKEGLSRFEVLHLELS